MIKQTLMFTTPVSLSLKDQQMVITFKDNKDTKRVKSIVPNTGMVSILSVTDKQYGDIINFWGKEKEKKVPTDPLQLEFF